MGTELHFKRIFVVFMLISIINLNLIFIGNKSNATEEPLLTLTAAYRVNQIEYETLNIIKQQLARVGINLEIHNINWPFNLLMDPPPDYSIFDMILTGFTPYGYDPYIYSFLYSENGSQPTQIFIINYNEELDYNTDLGMGKNEWYLKHGAEIIPSNSDARINHYYEWENYLMDKIVPIKPLYNPKHYAVSWTNLEGYDINKSLKTNWGHMSWDGTHQNQLSTDTITITRNLFNSYQGYKENPPDATLCLDSLIVFDEDMKDWPHLAENIEFLDSNHLRITCRQGIKWASDPEGNFTNDYFDAEDVYFTLFYAKEIMNKWDYYCIDSMEIIDNYTIDLFLNYDEPYYQHLAHYKPFYSFLSCNILPEHYLNQSQKWDGWPDTNHIAWDIFEETPFGTGLFTVDHFTPFVETIYTVNPNSWWFNETITNDPMLNWETRFGDFTNSPTTLRVLPVYYDEQAYALFEVGNVDLLSTVNSPTKIEQYLANPSYNFYENIYYTQKFLAYNLKLNAGIIGSIEPCPNNPDMTIGLAIRKALSYAINTAEINDILYAGKYYLTNSPITDAYGIWCNPNIVKYDYNIEKAQELLATAGFGTFIPTNLTKGANIIFILFMQLLMIIPIIIQKKTTIKTTNKK